MTSNSNHVNLSEINFKLKYDTRERKIRENVNDNGDNYDATRVDNFSNVAIADQLPLKTIGKNSKYLYKEPDINVRSNTGISNSDNIKQESESESSKYTEKSNIRSQSKTKVSNTDLEQSLGGYDCFKQAVTRCVRCALTALKEHKNTCIIALTVVSIFLFIIIIILISLPKELPEGNTDVKRICDYDPCLNNGTCSESKNRFICSCPAGYLGELCEETPCTNTECWNGGVCVITSSVGNCKCLAGFVGEKCEVTPCGNVTCQNGGRCHVIDGEFLCSCPNGTSGTFCTVTACTNVTCQNDGQCHVINGNISCYCPKGTSGTFCEVTPCIGIQCFHGGTCLFTPEVTACACSYKYYGKACERECKYGASFHSCTFEDDDNNCFLLEDINDDFNWTRNKGSTPSRNTGPTSAIEGLYYLYTEASPPVHEGHTARLISKEKYAGCSRCLRFSYHMHGLAVGKLNIYQGINTVWSRSGNNGDTWNSVFLDIFGTVNGSIIFEAVRGSGVTGDIAVDDIWFSPGRCP